MVYGWFSIFISCDMLSSILHSCTRFVSVQRKEIIKKKKIKYIENTSFFFIWLLLGILTHSRRRLNRFYWFTCCAKNSCADFMIYLKQVLYLHKTHTYKIFTLCLVFTVTHGNSRLTISILFSFSSSSAKWKLR